MSVPGPSGGVLILGLVGFGAFAALVGEGVRIGAARWVAAWRDLEALERVLLDVFLGGAAFYVLALIPLGLFGWPSLLALGVLSAVAVVIRLRRAVSVPQRLVAGVRSLLLPPALLTLLAAFGVLVFEVSLASPVGTGNTYDSSLLTLYTSRLVATHQLAFTFQPYASAAVLYPQGTTVWMGAAQLLLGLPGARTTLLVTPLFFALAPIGGYVLGRRWFGTARAGLAVALTLALLASWTRALVGGSNDLVLAFPLVLLALGQASDWLRRVPSVPDVVAFGLLLGYSAALNPIGAEWLLPALLLAGLLYVPRYAGSAGKWVRRWGTALGAALLPLAPTWWVLAGGSGGTRTGTLGTGATSSGSGIDGAQFVGFVDPYLFRTRDVWLSPVPALRLELALLLTVGLALVVLAPRSPLARFTSPFRTFLVAGFVVLVGFLGLELAAENGFGPAATLSLFTSAGELSIWLFTLYAVVAALPLVVLFEWLAVARRSAPSGTGPPTSSSRRANHTPRRRLVAGFVPLALALLVLLSGVAFTATQLPAPLATLYSDFGNVTGADFDLLEFIGAHVPAGSRLLVAPGSAAEFAPAYATNVVLLYPMIPGWGSVNASYTLVVRELTNGTLDASGRAAMNDLGVEYVAVTGASTTLWPPFEPGPLLASGTYHELFHEGDAYLFGTPPPVLPP